MQPVEADREQTVSVSGSDLEWGRLVDCNIDRIWRLALSFGLSHDDAAQVCQLTWLRLSQRFGDVASDAGVAQWLDDTVTREARALLRHHAARELRRGARVAASTVIPLSREAVAETGALLIPPR